MTWKVMSFKVRNLPRMLRSWSTVLGAKLGAALGGLTMYATVKAVWLHNGKMYNLGVVGHRSVTNAGVAFMATNFKDGSKSIANFKYHASGTGSTAENVTDTALGTEVTDNARTAGTNTTPSANVYQTVDTISYTGNHAITEHGIFDQVTAAGSTLWDRTVFAAINVANGDSIQFTYQLTVNAGG